MHVAKYAFDKSTGTIDHIDSWYLDTDPMGHLIAAWIALEDIDGDGGEFHVYPCSHLIEKNVLLLGKILIMISSLLGRKKYKLERILFTLEDVLFWHPSLLHGASNQRVEGHSRKSLVHYYPERTREVDEGYQLILRQRNTSKKYLKDTKKSGSFTTYQYLHIAIDAQLKGQ